MGEAEASAAPEFALWPLFAMLPDAVVIGEAGSGRVVMWNDAAAHMFGFEPSQGPGLLIERLVPDAMRDAHRAGIRRFALGEPTPLLDSESVVELPALRQDGGELWVELRLAHLQHESARYALAVIRDITARREAEEARAGALAALQNVQRELEARNELLDRVARTDHLTGLWNRRHVEEHLTMATSAARRHDRCVSLLLIDVDDFKSVNSTWGHQAGDAVLQELASRLLTEVRAEDTLGRWGGEEFVVVLPDIEPATALLAAERLRVCVERAPFRVGELMVPVTISVGAAGAWRPTATELLHDADLAVRRAKVAGRNRVEVQPGRTA